MQTPLRQATAGQGVTIGPFVSDSDAKTPATSLTINDTDIQIIANGQPAAAKNSGGANHRANGEYSITLDEVDTATVGELAVNVTVAGSLPVRAKFTVLTAAVYDALYAATAAAKVDLVDAPNATAVTAIQSGLGTTANQSTIASAIDGIPAATEAAILDEGDATPLLAAIAAKVEEFLINDGDSAATLSAIATAVWSKSGRSLSVDPPTSSQIADAVLDELLSGHATAGTLGKAVTDILAAVDTAIPGLIAALNDFDPASDTVARVTLVDTTSVNSDMRGTDGAYTGTPPTPPTPAENAAGLLDLTDGVETSYTVRQLFRLLLALAAGDSVGGTTYKNPAGTKDRIVSTVDESNNRTVTGRDVT